MSHIIIIHIHAHCLNNIPVNLGMVLRVICNILAAESLSWLRRACFHEDAISRKKMSWCLEIGASDFCVDVDAGAFAVVAVASGG